MKKLVGFASSLLLIFLQGQAIAAVNVSVVSASRITLVPGVDLVRQNIANVVIDADQPYTVQLSDDNGGGMVMGYHSIPYRVSYNDNADVRLSASPKVMESAASVSNGNRVISVTIMGVDTATAAAGDYRSTLTVTITAF